MPTGIEWATETWNPVTGCTKVSQGCLNCYAESYDRRFSKNDGRDFVPWTVKAQRDAGVSGVALHPERLDIPLHWQKPRRIFVNSMSDLFHEDVPEGFLILVWATMADCSQHTFQVLTKRPERALQFLTDQTRGQDRLWAAMPGFMAGTPPWPLPNVWLGVSVENQVWADRRIPILAKIPAAVRFVSCEPLLGSVDLTPWLGEPWDACPRPVCPEYCTKPGPNCPRRWPSLGWVIVGGESGSKARPMHPDWARQIRDDCKQSGVPFFFKQWGQWLPVDQKDVHEGSYIPNEPGMDWRKLGKKEAGADLDGFYYREMPV